MPRSLRFDSLDDLNAWLLSRGPTKATGRKPLPRSRPCPTEEQEQIALLSWCRLAAGQFPALSLLFAVPNGGFRLKSEAARFQRLGLIPGIPDLVLPVARKGAHALYIELKALDGSPSSLQIHKAVELVSVGNIVAFCFGWSHARDTLTWYLEKD